MSSSNGIARTGLVTAAVVISATWIVGLAFREWSWAPAGNSFDRVIYEPHSSTAAIVDVLMNEIIGDSTEEIQNLSFALPTGKCNKDMPPEECCPNIPKSLMKKIPDSKRIPQNILIGIGTPKSGSQFMYQLLVQHPAFHGGFRKHLRYFSEYDTYKEGMGGYLNKLWLNESTPQDVFDEKIAFEFTPGMMKIPWAPCLLRAWFPNARFLILLRNPVARALSHFRFHRSTCFEKGEKGSEYCCRHFQEPLDMLKKHLESIKEAGCGFHDGKGIGTWRDCIDKLWGRDSVDAGESGMLIRNHYGPQIAWWMEFFPASRFTILKAEELYKDPLKSANDVLDALDVAPKFGKDGIPLIITEEEKHTTNFTNIFEPNIDVFVDSLERFHQRPNLELIRFFQKMGIDEIKFNSSEVHYKNGEITKKEFCKSLGVQI